MVESLRRRVPIQARLTLWYVFWMGATLAAFSLLLYARFQRSLRDAVDRSLHLAVLQVQAGVDLEDYLNDGRLAFEKSGGVRAAPLGFSMRMLSPDGVEWDTFGVEQGVSWGAAVPGYATLAGVDGSYWRVLSQPALGPVGEVIGWVQAAQSMASSDETLNDLLKQLVWVIPPVLVLAGLGGYFLANRALSPIERITHAAREIGASDLSRRLDYRGPPDVVGRLAHTFDQMLSRLESAFERERRFASDAAHELRTPLTALKGQIEVTLNQRRKPQEYEEKFRLLATQVDRLVRLSNALLFLSLSDQDRLSWDPVDLNLVAVLDAILEQARPLAEARKLAVAVDLPSDLPVFGDPDHLTRLFLNLVDNAVKYTPDGGSLSMVAGSARGGVQVRIHNTGAAIPEEQLSRLFERFYRLAADRSSQTGGAGLGLAIAYEIVRLHRGEILAESGASEGVTFTVWLPGDKKTLNLLSAVP